METVNLEPQNAAIEHEQKQPIPGENGKIYLPTSIVDKLPAMVKTELKSLPASRQEEFKEEYERKIKSKPVAYIFWLFGLHYAYFRQWGMLFLYWVTFGGLFIWVIIDAFRIPNIVNNQNKDTAIDTMRNLKAFSG